MKNLFIILCLLLLCFIPANAGVINVVNNSMMVPAGGGYATIGLDGAYASTAYGNHTNTSTSAPTGATAGDLLIFLLYIENTASVTVPSGATLLADVSNPGAVLTVHVAYKVATGSDSYAWTHSAADTAAFCKRFTNVNTTTPLDATPSESATDWDTTLTAAAITTSTNGAAVLMIGAAYNQSLVSSSTMTELIDEASLGLTGALQATAGSSGNKSMVYPGESSLAGVLFALKPASL